MRAGAHDFLIKPVDLELMVLNVMKALEKKRLEEEVEAYKKKLERSVEERAAELAKAKKELRESKKRLRSLSSKVLSAQEEERKRISSELHDSLGATLTAIKFSLEDGFRLVEEGGPISESLKATVPLTRYAIEETRRISRDLRPSVLDDLGILAAIKWFCGEFQTLHPDIQVEKQIHIREDEVPNRLKIILYRIIQEATNNVTKYSKAGLLCLSFERKNGKIELAIRDNGQGFDLKGALSGENSKHGLGLTSRRERAELSGGVLTIESSRGRGTTIKATWPAKK